MTRQELINALIRLNELYSTNKVETTEYERVKERIEKSFKGFHVVHVTMVQDRTMFRSSHALILA